ncbi:hypothetical protein B7Z28_00965, partial [Candidatus Saccharibacteria bacterium 32-45-3]
FFGALALPLRKDQPMEIYMAAIVSFYLKPRQRLWDPEGIETLIEITAPKTVEFSRSKALTQDEARQRLSYLSGVVDSGGWSIRGVSGANGTAMNTDLYTEAQGTQDMLDVNNSIAHNFDQMMIQSANKARDEARQHMMQAAIPQSNDPQSQIVDSANDPLLIAMSQEMGIGGLGQSYNQNQAPMQPQPIQGQYQIPSQQSVAGFDSVATSRFAYSNNVDAPTMPGSPHFNPYPTFHQSVVQPLNDIAHQAQSDIEAPVVEAPQYTATIDDNPVSDGSTHEHTREFHRKSPIDTSDSGPTADIINLANNPDLSIETIAREAHRLHKKAEEESEEIVISLR